MAAFLFDFGRGIGLHVEVSTLIYRKTHFVKVFFQNAVDKINANMLCKN